jgi:hypothetical protein
MMTNLNELAAEGAPKVLPDAQLVPLFGVLLCLERLRLLHHGLESALAALRSFVGFVQHGVQLWVGCACGVGGRCRRQRSQYVRCKVWGVGRKKIRMMIEKKKEEGWASRNQTK